MTRISNIIFDLGGVLVDWSPDYMYQKLIPEPQARKHFLDTVCTLDWNEQQDGGRLIVDANIELISKFPQHKTLIEAYYQRWEEMLGGAIQPTVEIFRQLKDKKSFGIYALTNWSAETFPRALEIFDFLHWFDGRIVSGEEKTRKPFKEIYDLTLARFNLVANETLFIDDNLRNIKAADELGILTHHFLSAEGLEIELKRLGLL
jgi:2-haloacid dehalogenase